MVSHSEAVKKDFGRALRKACNGFIAYLNQNTENKHRFESDIVENTSRKFSVLIEIKRKGVLKKTRIQISAYLELRRPPLPPGTKNIEDIPEEWKGQMNFPIAVLEQPDNLVYHQLAASYAFTFHKIVKSEMPVEISLYHPNYPDNYKEDLAKKMLAILEAKAKNLLAAMAAFTEKKYFPIGHHSYIKKIDRISAVVEIKRKTSMLSDGDLVLNIEALIARENLKTEQKLIFTLYDPHYETIVRELSPKILAALEAGTSREFSLLITTH